MVESESKRNKKDFLRIKELESEKSKLKLEVEEAKILLNTEREKRLFYELVSEFTYGWEIWIEPDGTLKYSSPSCYDFTGYTANQIMSSSGIDGLLVYEPDRKDFNQFISKSLDQLLVNHSHEFRLLTRHKQLRWCSMNVRGVYNKQGRYLGIRGSIHDITHLKQTLGKIKDLSTGREIENRAKLRYKTELDLKERELVTFLLQLSQKNEIITYIIKNLKKLKNSSTKKLKEGIDQVLSVIENVPDAPVDWEMIIVQLENLHPGFLDRLLAKHPNLTSKEKKLCAFLRLDLSSKDISGLQNVLPKSIEIARVRLRKKLRINRKVRLNTYIHSI